MWAWALRIFGIASIASLGDTIGNLYNDWFKPSPNQEGVFGQLSNLIKWFVVGAAIYFFYTVVLGKKIKIGK
jgi:hypothetical protein